MNWYIFTIAAIFFYEENQYFGWNIQPKSDAELISDGIVLLFLAMSLKGGAA